MRGVQEKKRSREMGLVAKVGFEIKRGFVLFPACLYSNRKRSRREGDSVMMHKKGGNLQRDILEQVQEKGT